VVAKGWGLVVVAAEAMRDVQAEALLHQLHGGCQAQRHAHTFKCRQSVDYFSARRAMQQRKGPGSAIVTRRGESALPFHS
jgi:hypothetical protein